ncbi:hypothetical protein SEA_DEJAVU_87 [Microbacterium Phage DejaVu]|nr:hypothetical protein LUPINE_86 [Microbacterium phage Lupine]QDK03329.1 hypothetical protein SEA_ROMAN_88 [Microbacterium phage Roman]WNM66219.1 hypothetical protein SEA_DEJAVU_87 [Microbacterium Phage DejaVu]
MSEKLWVLFIMDEETAEPKPVVVRSFTRFEMRRMESAVRALEHYGVPARFDAVREEVVSTWLT